MLFLVAVVLAVLMSLVQMLYQALQKCCSRVYNCKSKKTKKNERKKRKAVQVQYNYVLGQNIERVGLALEGNGRRQVQQQFLLFSFSFFLHIFQELLCTRV